jgi:uncharacterized BrkB/YihY/UPF0761 family membrane protein
LYLVVVVGLADTGIIVPPPTPKTLDYPVAITMAAAIVATTILVIITSKFDPTAGPLTISILIVVTFIGVAVFCLFFTVPNDEITSGVIGGLIASFGAVIAHWLGKPRP